MLKLPFCSLENFFPIENIILHHTKAFLKKIKFGRNSKFLTKIIG